MEFQIRTDHPPFLEPLPPVSEQKIEDTLKMHGATFTVTVFGVVIGVVVQPADPNKPNSVTRYHIHLTDDHFNVYDVTTINQYWLPTLKEIDDITVGLMIIQLSFFLDCGNQRLQGACLHFFQR
jgi:hypothetical protein